MQLPQRPLISPLILILITIVIDRIGESLIFPILPFLVEPFGLDALGITLLFSAFAAAQFLAAPVLGALSDQFGRRPVLLFCVFGTAVSYFVFALANQAWIFFVSRIIDGVTGGVVSTAQAYIADSSKPEDRAKNFGLTGAAFGIGFIVGPAIGGSLAVINPRLPILLAGVISLVNVVAAYYILPESLPPDHRSPIRLQDLNPFRQLGTFLAIPQVSGLMVAFFVFNFAFGGFTSVFVLILKEAFNWGVAQAGLVFVVVGIVSTIVQAGLIRRLIPWLGEVRLTVVGFICLAGALMILPWIPRLEPGVSLGVFGSVVLLAFGVGIMSPSLRGLISNRVSAQDQGKVMGSSQGLASVAGILGPAWAGWVFSGSQLAPAWQAGILMLLALGFALLSLRPLSGQSIVK